MDENIICYFCGDDAEHSVDGIWMCANCALAWIHDANGARRLMQRVLEVDGIKVQPVTYDVVLGEHDLDDLQA